MIKLQEECKDMADQTYLFDVPNPNGKPKYCVDATEFGNESRFINHSCNPNLVGVTMVGYHGDPSLARIAFFTKRNIKAGDELSISYYQHQVDSKRVGKSTPKCRCGAKNCRGFLI